MGAQHRVFFVFFATLFLAAVADEEMKQQHAARSVLQFSFGSEGSNSFDPYNFPTVPIPDDSDGGLTQAEQDLLDAILRFKASVPRWDLSGNTVEAEFDLEGSQYRESLIVAAIPSATVAVLCLLLCFIYLPFKCCNKKCKFGKEGGYNTQEKLIPKYVLFACALLILGLVILGYVADGQVVEGANGVFDHFYVTAEALIRAATEISETAARLSVLTGQQPPPGTAPQEALDIIDLIVSGRDGIDEVQEWEQTGIEYRAIAIHISFISSTLCCLTGIMGAITNKPKTLFISSILGFLALFSIWIAFGVNLPVSLALADLCVSIDDVVNGTSVSTVPGLGFILECLDDGATLDFVDLNEGAVGQIITDVNDELASNGINVTFTADNISLIFEPRFEAIDLLLDGIISEQAETINTFTLLNTQLDIIQDCTYLRYTFEAVERSLCVSMLKGQDLQMGAQGMIGLLLLVLVPVVIICSIRLGTPVPQKKATQTTIIIEDEYEGAGDVTDDVILEDDDTHYQYIEA